MGVSIQCKLFLAENVDLREMFSLSRLRRRECRTIAEPMHHVKPAAGLLKTSDTFDLS